MKISSGSSKTALRTCVSTRTGISEMPGSRTMHSATSDAEVAPVEERGATEPVVDGGLVPDEFAQGICRRERHNGGGEDACPNDPDGEKPLCQGTSEGFECARRVSSRRDGQAVDVQSCRAGDDDEEPNNAGQYRSGDYIDAFIAQVVDGEFLVYGVGLNEAQAPRARVVPTVAVTMRRP
jgi:hypothetical protein